MDELLAPVLDHVDRHDPGGVIGLYLHGSGAATGLQRDSDVDLLVVTRRSLTDTERSGLLKLLLGISGWRGHAEQFPDVADRRPLELTSLVLSDIVSVTARPCRDFQYGEWLRAESVAGALPTPADDPDVVMLLAAARQSSRTLHGRALRDLVDATLSALLRSAAVTLAPSLVGEIEGDERNVLLTLARLLVTVDTGRIVSKDVAAKLVSADYTFAHRQLLTMARDGYLGRATDDWSDRIPQVRALAEALALAIRTNDPIRPDAAHT